MKKRHKLMMVLPIAACLIAAIAVALAAGNHANPQPDVLAAPVLENTESPQPETCVYFTDEGFTGFEDNCYHAVQDCGGMIGARAGTVDEAVELGKFPCPVCLADAVVPADNEIYGGNTERPLPESDVYFTKGGKYYHAVQDCGGMIGARAGTVDEAVELGKFPCPVCLADAVVPADNEIYGGNTERPLPESDVYFTKGGKYYHAVQDCGGMIGARAGTVDEAVALGKFPCPVCLEDWIIEVPTVWCTKNGQYYHTDQFCSHMHNAQSTTPEQAISEGKQPCPVCVAAETESEAAYSNETLSN